MFFSLWLGIVLTGGQTGCSLLRKDSTDLAVLPPPAVLAPPLPTGGQPMQRGLRNPDYYQVPKVPPPGARTTYSSVRVNGPYIAMTFDDGPHPSNTPRLLNILRERNVKATFFVVGQLAKEYPQIIRRILAEGHEIGNHTMSHPTLTRISDEAIRRELSSTHKALVDIAGYHARLFRPPGGATNARLKQWFYDEYGYCTIMWSVDPMDWKRPGVSVVTSRLVNGAQPGGILLAHDLHSPTVDAMPNTLDSLLSKGYRFVTVSQLLNMDTGGTAAPAVAAHAPSATTGPGGPVAPMAPSGLAPLPQAVSPVGLQSLPPASVGFPSEVLSQPATPPGL